MVALVVPMLPQNKFPAMFVSPTFGCETWIQNKSITKHINAVEDKCYREILRVSWTEHSTNQSIADELGVTY